MKKKNSLLFILLMYSLTMLAQKDITKFMGIPVDGFKKDMIHKLKAKGFEYDNEIDLLTGEFNGEKVNIFVATQSNKVWRIVVADAIERNEHDIKIRFNNLYDQFNDNPKYVPKLEDNDYISEDINLAYEMKVRNKRFEAGFMQMTNPKSPQNSPEKIQQELTQKINEENSEKSFELAKGFAQKYNIQVFITLGEEQRSFQGVENVDIYIDKDVIKDK